MKEIEVKSRLDNVASSLVKIASELESMESKLSLNMDKVALSEMVSSLHWAAENASVIALHQIGEAMDDNMGTGLND